MKQFMLLIYILLCCSSCFAQESDIFAVKDVERNVNFSISDSREKIEKIYKTNLNGSTVTCEGLEIILLGEKIISIDVQSSNYLICGGIKTGDSVKKIKSYIKKDSDFTGKFDDGTLFDDFYFPLKSTSLWKEPQYVIRVLYNADKISEIILFYVE